MRFIIWKGSINSRQKWSKDKNTQMVTKPERVRSIKFERFIAISRIYSMAVLFFKLIVYSSICIGICICIGTFRIRSIAGIRLDRFCGIVSNLLYCCYAFPFFFNLLNIGRRLSALISLLNTSWTSSRIN